MGTLPSTAAAIPLRFDLRLLYLSLLCPEALKAVWHWTRSKTLDLQGGIVELMVSSGGKAMYR